MGVPRKNEPHPLLHKIVGKVHYQFLCNVNNEESVCFFNLDSDSNIEVKNYSKCPVYVFVKIQ